MRFLTSSGTILWKTKTTAVSEPAYEVMWQVTMDLSRRAQNLSALCQHFLYLNYMPKNLHHLVVAKPTPVAFGVVTLANLQRSFQIPTLQIYLWMLIRLKMHPVTTYTQAHILQRAEAGEKKGNSLWYIWLTILLALHSKRWRPSQQFKGQHTKRPPVNSL